jgi:transcription elongation GreA/GreB family factor
LDRKQANIMAEDFLTARIKGIQAELNDLKEGIASDSKSTAGDKHETARAMAQLEQEQLATQLTQMQEHLQVIQQAKRIKFETRISFGSLVRLTKGWFYLSTGIGVVPGDINLFCLSMHTPMGQALLGKATGESTVVNGQHIEILEHC